MSDNNITQDQLEPNVMEELESGIGDLSTLSTENKDSLVAAVTEIYGKNVIAEAIGEPLAVTDTFNEMSSEINGLLSTFKTNMMNSGVVVESGDKFKQLIEKIKGLTEGEGNKGIQFTSLTTDVPITSNEYDSVSFTLDFVPSLIFITIDNMNIEYPGNYRFNVKQNKGVVNNIHHTSMETCLEIENTIVYGTSTIYSPMTYYYITVNDQLFNFHYMNNAPDIFNKMSITYYAIGVGEEDTTLRDSLASILEEEGVSVTEEDDMASLIGKVDEEFDNKNNEMESNKGLDIISATELPATGNNMQLCAITDTISDSFILSNDEADVKISGTDIGIQLTELTMYDKYSYPMGGSTINLRIATTYQNASAIPLWLYYNNAWVQICSTKVIAISNKILQDGFTMGTTNSYGYYGETAGLVLKPGSSANLFGFTPFNNTIDFSKHKAIRIKGTYKNTTSSTGTYGPGIGIFGRSTNLGGGTSSGAGYGLSSTTSTFDALFSYTKTFNSSVTTSTPFDFTFDISKTNTCYLGIVTAMTEYTYITDLEFILK